MENQESHRVEPDLARRAQGPRFGIFLGHVLDDLNVMQHDLAWCNTKILILALRLPRQLEQTMDFFLQSQNRCIQFQIINSPKNKTIPH